jgi:hypothetical protein
MARLEACLQQEGPRVEFRVLFTLAILAAIFFLSLGGVRPPVPEPPSAPASQFSAGRAREVLHRLIGDGIPHPTGSAANDVVRGRVIAELTALGYAPQVQTGFSCDEYGTCATVKNVLARLDGKESGAAVLLAAHYDSVAAGPGASDDGVGTATVLEIARALKTISTLRNSVIFLVDDGEEAGLLGARVFVDQNPWAKEVRAAVNVEARGTSGPSVMFETGNANAWVVRLYAKNVSRPATSSIFYQAYKQLPNDTDFTVFKAAGYQGVNFAFIGDEPHYHTPLDNFENVNAASLQHQGDNALPMVLAFGNADLANPPQSEAVFFSVFERWMIWWPANRTLPIAIASAMILFLQIGWLVAKKRLEPIQMLWGLVGWLAMFTGAGLLGIGLQQILRVAGAMPGNWVAHPVALKVAFWSLALAVVACAALGLGRRAGFWGFWAGVWTWWALLAVLVSWLSQGFAFILLVPVCVAAVGGLPFSLRQSEARHGTWLASMLPLAVAGILGFDHAILLYSALGVRILAGITVVVALLLTPLAPILADLRESRGFLRIAIPGLAIAAMLVAAFASIIVPAYSAKAPEHVNIQYRLDGDSGKSQWVVHTTSGRLPEALRVATNFHRLDNGLASWDIFPAFVANAPHLDLAAPTFTILESSEVAGKRKYRALLRSERGAPDAMVLFPPDSGIEGVRVEGEPVQPETELIRRYVNRWHLYDCMTMPAKGVEISFELPLGKPVEVDALDQTYALPLEGMFLLKSRPLTATRFSQGDLTIVIRRVQLNP